MPCVVSVLIKTLQNKAFKFKCHRTANQMAPAAIDPQLLYATAPGVDTSWLVVQKTILISIENLMSFRKEWDDTPKYLSWSLYQTTLKLDDEDQAQAQLQINLIFTLEFQAEAIFRFQLWP